MSGIKKLYLTDKILLILNAILSFINLIYPIFYLEEKITNVNKIHLLFFVIQLVMIILIFKFSPNNISSSYYGLIISILIIILIFEILIAYFNIYKLIDMTERSKNLISTTPESKLEIGINGFRIV